MYKHYSMNEINENILWYGRKKITVIKAPIIVLIE